MNLDKTMRLTLMIHVGQSTLDAKVSRKVLAMARDQQDELAQEELLRTAEEDGLA